jgi:hypothetical protein
MTHATYRGVVRDGKVILLDQQMPLVEGTEVLVTPMAGTRAAVLAAVDRSPQVPAGWVDQLEQVIADGHRPPSQPDPFRDERQERP